MLLGSLPRARTNKCPWEEKLPSPANSSVGPPVHSDVDPSVARAYCKTPTVRFRRENYPRSRTLVLRCNEVVDAKVMSVVLERLLRPLRRELNAESAAAVLRLQADEELQARYEYLAKR